MPAIALVSLALCAAPLAAQGQPQGAGQPRRITKSTVLPKGAILDTPLVIAANDITIDGQGATIVGPARPGDPKTGRGDGITIAGWRGVVIRNVKVRGFRSGLVMRNSTDCRIENCDFSGNYHDPQFGWGDGARVGGMILTDTTRTRIVDTTARHNWNGLDLLRCSAIEVLRCDLSRCSNVCLKLWNASRNTIRHCDLSYGLRIREGEVHARDSTCVLLESGSDDNQFADNDITHGGDGVFIRVLNGWISTGNVFLRNDCSYANNNGFESWSPGNAYYDNKANHCSYGFWLGGSDRTVLVGNEASHNGREDGFHNAPEPDFGHGGIVLVNGTGSHTVIDRNTCVGNRGGGIVFRGDLATRGAAWRMREMVVQRNTLRGNRWGIFARFVDGLVLGGNRHADNEKDEHLEDVTDLRRPTPTIDAAVAPPIAIVGPRVVALGTTATWGVRPANEATHVRWRIGAHTSDGPTLQHTFASPGLHLVGATASRRGLAHVGARHVYSIDPAEHASTEAPRGWRAGAGFAETRPGLVGQRAVFATGRAVSLRHALPAPADVTRATALRFWLRVRNLGPRGWRAPTPAIRLETATGTLEFTPQSTAGLPTSPFLQPAASENREGWQHFEVPLAGGAHWHREIVREKDDAAFVSARLLFTTIHGAPPTSRRAGLATDGTLLYCAHRDGISASPGGHLWRRLPQPPGDARPDWLNGMLTFWPGYGEQGALLLTARRNDARARRLLLFDLATDAWRWHPTTTAMGHGATLVGDQLFGLAHAVGGNYGGPVCRVDLDGEAPDGSRTVLGALVGDNSWWFSRAAQLATLGGQVYGVKNDWLTPQPENPAARGDRLFTFDPRSYAASRHTGGDRWTADHWTAATTPATDLGALPFEVGHGCALVALPPHFGRSATAPGVVGARGGLFLVAGCSPSNHEGHGRPGSDWAMFDAATRRFTRGTLPGPTGAGTAACLFGDRIVVKRGGLRRPGQDEQLWVVRPLPRAEAAQRLELQAAAAPDLTRLRGIQLTVQPAGPGPIAVWLDGLQLAGLPAPK